VGRPVRPLPAGAVVRRYPADYADFTEKNDRLLRPILATDLYLTVRARRQADRHGGVGDKGFKKAHRFKQITKIKGR
jgi:hypothetical protein